MNTIILSSLVFITTAGSVPLPAPSSSYEIQFPSNECGYEHVVFDTSMNIFSDSDTILFYATKNSNCGPQETSDLGCTSQMYMTNEYYSSLGYIPYTVWYNFENVEENMFVTLRYNYNNTATHIVGTIMCTDTIIKHEYTLDKCMFSQQLYSYKFFDFYKIKFYMSCKYVDDEISFYIDQSSHTCVGDVVNINKFNLVSFDSWYPVTSTVLSNTFCRDCETTTTTQVEETDVEIVTVTVIPTVTFTQSTTVPVLETVTVTHTHQASIIINNNNNNL